MKKLWIKALLLACIFVISFSVPVTMAMLELRQSTSVGLILGPFLDSTDGDSEEDGLTISAAENVWRCIGAFDHLF